jgi:hypothetical protein
LLDSLLLSDSSQNDRETVKFAEVLPGGDLALTGRFTGSFADFRPGATVAIDMNSHTGPLA